MCICPTGRLKLGWRYADASGVLARSSILKGIRQFFSSVTAIAGLAWRSTPIGVTALVSLNMMQGVMPIGSAVLTKWLLDDLSAALVDGASLTSLRRLVLVAGSLAALSFAGALVRPVAQLVAAKVARKTTLHIRTRLYRKLNSFVGLKYFEEARFYDSIRLVTQWMSGGPVQVVATSASILQSAVTLAGFVGVILALGPCIAVLIAVSISLHLYAQIKIGGEKIPNRGLKQPSGTCRVLLQSCSFRTPLGQGSPTVRPRRILLEAPYWLAGGG